MIEKSIGIRKTVHGIEVKRMTIGKYLEFSEDLEKLLVKLKENNISLNNSLDYLKKIDKEKIILGITKILKAAPEIATEILPKALDIEKEKIIDNEEIGLNELIDIIAAFIEINNLGKLTEKIKEMIKKAAQMLKIKKAGYKD